MATESTARRRSRHRRRAGHRVHHGTQGLSGRTTASRQPGRAGQPGCSRPTILALSVVIVYPIITAIVMSFQKDAGLDPATGLFVEGGPAGFSNYYNWIFQQCPAPDGGTVDCPPGTLGAQFWSAIGTTFFFTVVTVALETVLGFWMAVIMEPGLQGPQPGPRGRPDPVGHPHRRDGQAVASSSSPSTASPTSSSTPPSCGPAANGRPGWPSSSPTSGRPRRSWRC